VKARQQAPIILLDLSALSTSYAAEFPENNNGVAGPNLAKLATRIMNPGGAQRVIIYLNGMVYDPNPNDFGPVPKPGQIA
jgi:hypothetical protein